MKKEKAVYDIGRRRKLKDRSDGYYLTKLDAISKLMPYIMKERNDALVYFSERVELDNIEPFIYDYRQKYGKKIGFMHILIAALVRAMAEKPKINRFISGNKPYARKDISVSFVMKKTLTEASREAAIKNIYDRTATLHDVVKVINDSIEENKVDDFENDTDVLAKVISLMPGFLIKFSMWGIRFLDGLGILPKSIISDSPFHTSVFVTNLGSLGIKGVYHHIYNFGTVSLFLGFGVKECKLIETKDGIRKQKYIDLKVVADERIVDGYYMAQAIKTVMKYLRNPEKLLEPPKKIEYDNQI